MVTKEKAKATSCFNMVSQPLISFMIKAQFALIKLKNTSMGKLSENAKGKNTPGGSLFGIITKSKCSNKLILAKKMA